MSPVTLIKNMLIISIIIMVGYKTYEWIQGNINEKGSSTRYKDNTEQPIVFDDVDNQLHLDDCHRHLDPTVIELCVESKVKNKAKE